MNDHDMPCGECNCGVYSEMALLNPKARSFANIQEEERVKHINICKKNKDKLCAGEMDFHLYLCKLDKVYYKLNERKECG